MKVQEHIITGKTLKLRQHTAFLISKFLRFLNVVFFILGYSPAYEFYVPTFRKTVPSS